MRKYLKNLQGCLKSSFISSLRSFSSLPQEIKLFIRSNINCGYKQASGAIFKTQKVLYVGKVALWLWGEK